MAGQRLATDDWPYIYHRGHSIPRAHFNDLAHFVYDDVAHDVGNFPCKNLDVELFLGGGISTLRDADG